MLGAVHYARPCQRQGPARQWGSMSDLLSRIANDRSDEAFRSLFKEYAPRVRHYMLRQGAEPDLADELAHETLVTVWRKAALYSSDKGTAATWIYTIARNLRIDRLRREVPWQALPDDHDQIASEDVAPDVAVVENERQQRIRRLLADLPAEQVEVVMLSYVEGLSHSEIADRLKVPLGTVKSRMRLAYQRIRPAVEDLK